MKFQNEWRANIEARIAREGGLKKVVEKKDKDGFYAYGDWSKLARPGSLDQDLETAVEVAIGEYGHPYVCKFLGWAIEGLEKALVDPRFESDDDSMRGWKIDGIFPGNHGQVLVALALARAMRDDAEPDSPMLVQGAREIAQTELESGSYWTQGQSAYMRAINLLLIAGEVAEAKMMFKTRKKFIYTQQHFDWLKTFVMAIPDQPPHVLTDPAMHQHFQGKFDMYRNPAYVAPSKDDHGGNLTGSITMLRLELALLKQRYVLGLPSAGRWEHIVSHISE
ncbi:hypothetical protein [Variovorax paradoxus]|uniref:hypothetical protein n=1 Tax=Variovorax paradoxus TaxID=34073 RepID=UPI002786C8F8|nr:hypothetical protein [Variovorax paradoxus]MDP9929115.1 hypothetical protein [Variovorax paradoxus]